MSATTPDAGFAARFLDAGNALPGMRAMKSILLDQLELERGMRVLEMGCGFDDDSRALARRLGPQGEVVGAPGDDRALDVPAETFDRCCAQRLLMHREGDPAETVGAIVRVLRPGGRAALFELDWDSLVVDAGERELTRRIVRSFCDGLPNGCVGRTLPRLLREAGLVELDVVPHGVELPYDVFGWLLSGHLDAATADGRFSPAELIAWWDELDRADAEGRFFAAVLGFAVAGSKPAPPGGLARTR